MCTFDLLRLDARCSLGAIPNRMPSSSLSMTSRIPEGAYRAELERKLLPVRLCGHVAAMAAITAEA